MTLKDEAGLVGATSALGLGEKRGTRGTFKNLTDTLASLGRALEVVSGLDMASNLSSSLGAHGSLIAPPELLNRTLVVSQVLLASNQQDGETSAEMLDLREPLFLNVLERVRRVDSKANKDHMRIRIGKRAKTVVILLASGIPQSKLDVLAVDLDIGNIVLEHGRNINLGESSLREDNQQTGLSASTIADNNKFATDFGHFVSGLECLLGIE